jgi:hypothetical protein
MRSVNRKFRRARNVSKLYETSSYDEAVRAHLINQACMGAHKTHLQEQFEKFAWQLTDFGYWHILGALWNACLGQGEVQLWRNLFLSKRPNRAECLMKPDELQIYKRLQSGTPVMGFRAHRKGEEQWLSYVLELGTAKKMARHNGCQVITMFEIPDDKVLAVFDRRGYREILVPELGNFHDPVEFTEIEAFEEEDA